MINQKISKFSIFGMNCGNCVRTIKDSLIKIKGIKRISIDFFKKEAEIIFDLKYVNTNDIIELINSLGYQANEIESFELHSLM